MPSTVNVNLYHGSPVVPKIQLNYGADARSDFGIDVADQYPADATVTFDLHIDDEDGAKVVDGLVMSYQAGTDGIYIGTESPSPAIVKGQKYFWSINATSAAAIFQPFHGFETAKYNKGN